MSDSSGTTVATRGRSQAFSLGRALTPAEIFARDPVAFMKTHYVDPGDHNPNGFTSGATPLRFRFAAGYVTAKANGVVVPAYGLAPTSIDGPDSFLAYWCPYEANKFSMGVVGPAADYMFTALMDGCSFGAGTPAVDGTRTVCHANLMSQPGQGQKQNAILRGMKLGDRLLDPSAYMAQVTGANAAAKVTTFGVRDTSTGAWSFYYQLSKKHLTGTGSTGTWLTEIIDVLPI